jgi:hypothetical protein
LSTTLYFCYSIESVTQMSSDGHLDDNDRRYNQDWEEGSHNQEDCRSWTSPKSEGGYGSSGALNEALIHNSNDDNVNIINSNNNNNEEHNYHSTSSIRSCGSAASHESLERHSGHTNNNNGNISNTPSKLQHHNLQLASAYHLINGETNFPTAMSYVSDAQRSDAATVCSGSVVDDIEVESVLSQEDHLSVTNAGTGRSTGRSMNRLVEFALAASESEAKPSAPSSVIPRRHEAKIDSPKKPPSVLSPLEVHDMGPPLSRALLMQKAEMGLLHLTGHRAGSVGSTGANSDDCGGSLDVETHSVQSQEDLLSLVAAESHKGEDAGERGKYTLSQTGSVKSGGSQNGSDNGAQGDTDDCGGSLDVETYSLENENRSVYSQGDVETHSNHSQDEGVCNEGLEFRTDADKVSSAQAASESLLLCDDGEHANGRRSPGGTIYKGRGVRRYQGRYMNLPLKRFHQNGIHLDSTYEESEDNRHREEHNDDDSNERKRARVRSPSP